VRTFRTTVVFDFVVPDGTNPDEFHDELRDTLEGDEVAEAIQEMIVLPHVELESVREIEVEELEE